MTTSHLLRAVCAISLAVPLAIAGSASAQPAGSADASSAAAAPPAPAPAPAASVPATSAREICAAAMNADKSFAAEIIKIADEKAAKQRDDDLLAAHQAADEHVRKNERQVILAYAAMWIVAALFVLFLWRRQQALKGEIAGLRRDLELAGESTGKDRA